VLFLRVLRSKFARNSVCVGCSPCISSRTLTVKHPLALTSAPTAYSCASCDSHKHRLFLLWLAVSRLSQRRPGFSPLLSVTYFWWADLRWDKFFFEYFSFPLSALFYQCSTAIHSCIIDAIRSYLQCFDRLQELLLFMKWLFTESAQNILHMNQCVWYDHGLPHRFKGPGAVAIGLKGIKMRWWDVSSFSRGAEYTAVFKCPSR
jgi:hypothetical protein